MAKFRGTHFAFQKSTNPQSKQIGVQDTCRKMCGKVDFWITVSFPTLLPVINRVKFLQKEQKNARFFIV